MKTDKPIIAILGGTGKEGTGLALRWAAVGYRIMIGSRQAERAIQTADKIKHQLGMVSVSGHENTEAAGQADICVLTVTHSAHQAMIESLKDKIQGKILVDATARVDFKDPIPPKPPSAAELAQQMLGPATRVVAAFQNVPAKSLAQAIGGRLDAEVLVCSDDLTAAEQVVQLAQAAGIRGYYAGRLANAIVVEGLTSVLASLNKYYRVKEASILVTGIP